MLVQESFVRHRLRRRRMRIVIVLPHRGDIKIVLLRAAKLIVRISIFVLEGMFDGGRIVRAQGPGLRPLERHEFENHYRIHCGGG